MTKRTNINLDVALLDRAAAVLGTRRTTDTVHAALEEVVAQALRRRLAAQDFPDLTPETLEELRRPRSAAAASRSGSAPSGSTNDWRSSAL